MSNLFGDKSIKSNVRTSNKIDVSEWDVSNVKTMEQMFSYCKNFNCDLSSWNVSNVEDMSDMFYNCNSLKNKPNWYKA